MEQRKVEGMTNMETELNLSEESRKFVEALPEYLLRFTALGEESQLVIGTIITFGGILGYILLESKKGEA